MWKDYSIGFIKKNRASSISVMTAAFIAALLLSLLCSLFYNFWVYDVEEIVLEEGDWQGRIAGAFSEETIDFMNNHANVDKVIVHQETVGTAGGAESLEQTVADVYFRNPHRIFQDMSSIAEQLGLSKEQISYHYPLLAMYFIRIPGDEAPRLLLPFYVAIVAVVCISLILVIHNSFAVSMNARIRQLGILSGIGATPKQIRTCLLQEAAALCALPILSGSLVGIAAGLGALRMMDKLAEQLTGRHTAGLYYHPLLFVLTILAAALTVLISAWIPAKKLAKLTPLAAIRGSDEPQLRRKKCSPILSLLFGIEGELAGNALKAQKKALRTSTISLTLSFFGFTVMLCFFSLSGISTEYTYFARYRNVWDVMATVKNVRIEEFKEIEALQEAVGEQGAVSCVVYQKASAVTRLPASVISDELNALGGLEAVAGERAMIDGNTMQNRRGEVNVTDDRIEKQIVQTPLIILDDAGFQEYCEQIGIAPRLDGVVVLNRIWDSINSNFRYRDYIPFVKENADETILYNDAQEKNSVALPVLCYTEQTPVLREEYDDYALVHVVPLSLWKDIAGRITDVEAEAYIRILADRKIVDATADAGGRECSGMEQAISQILGQKYEIETENRIQEKLTNDQLLWGYKVVLGAFCGLLAIIGIANVFSYTMGFLRQRRQEFARYLSVGMTPAELRKMFCIEILVIAGRPVLITLPITALSAELMSMASFLNPAEFWMQAPFAPIAVFIAVIFGFVGLAYYIGGRRVMRDNLAEALRSEVV